MGRPTQDGRPARKADRRRLTDLVVRRLQPRENAYIVWDTTQRGLGIQVQPTGTMVWKTVYHHHGRVRWYTLGKHGAIGLKEARDAARQIMSRVALGEDPQAQKISERGAGTFAELAATYIEEHAKRHNKSWRQYDAMIRRHLVPRWGSMRAGEIERADVRRMRNAMADTPVAANQVQLVASAIFSWAIEEGRGGVTLNPCSHIRLNETRTRRRVLTDAEIKTFWHAAVGERGAALRMILLTAQRPGEIEHMRTEHVEDGWWSLPGEPDPEMGWPGTKTGRKDDKIEHRVWLSDTARSLIVGVGRAFPRGQLDAEMRRICRETGMDRATPHDLRRTAATHLAEDIGVDPHIVEAILNHASGTKVARTYNRATYDERKRVAMERWSEHVLRLVGERSDDTVVQLGLPA